MLILITEIKNFLVTTKACYHMVAAVKKTLEEFVDQKIKTAAAKNWCYAVILQKLAKDL